MHTLYLDSFRGKPAISEFDSLFTTFHKSHQHFAACMTLVLHPTFVGLQPVHGKLTQFRVTQDKLTRLRSHLKLACLVYSLTHHAKGKRLRH